ncbi:MAG: hypothetical protein WC375_08045 [Methanomassiliicoccales archaeon]|jgi:hypothetical protein
MSMPLMILYYTHNLVPRNLLITTLKRAYASASTFGQEAIFVVVSQFPVLANHTYVDINVEDGDGNFKTTIDQLSGLSTPCEIYQYLVRDVLLNECDLKAQNPFDELPDNLRVPPDKWNDIKFHNIVVGKLQYSYRSVLRQILLGITESIKCTSVILMEHDVLYPSSYVETATRLLKTHNITYCNKHRIYASIYGYLNPGGNILQSGISCRSDILQKITRNKLDMIRSDTVSVHILEPIIRQIITNYCADITGEIIVDNASCMDDNLPKHHDLLDMHHFLNTTGMVTATSNLYTKDHPYWGNHSQWASLLEIDMDEACKSKAVYGTFDY